jgi:hypothetical protein
MKVLHRILYLFAKFNTTYHYVQGFHELIFPFYFIALNGCRELKMPESRIEPICFHALQSLLVGTEFGEFFFLKEPEVVRDRFFSITACVLGFLDASVGQILSQHNFSPLVIAFPWATVLFCQMYPLPRLLHIWDVLLANSASLEILTLMIVVHIMRIGAEFRANPRQDLLDLVRGWMPRNEMEQVSRCRQCMSLIKIKGLFSG